MRWFVTDLDEEGATRALHAAGARGFVADTQVRFDAMLNLTVVRMEAPELSYEELHHVAVGAYAACISAELMGAVAQSKLAP